MSKVGYALLRDDLSRPVGVVVLVPEDVFDKPRQRRIMRDHLAEAANFTDLTVLVATRRDDRGLDFAGEPDQLVASVDWQAKLEWSEARLTWPKR